MKASLSQAGYTTATTIMSLELVLRVTENADETGRSGGQPVGQFVITPPAPTLGAACGLGDMSASSRAPARAAGRRGGGGGGGGQARAVDRAAVRPAGGGQPGGGQAAAWRLRSQAGGGQRRRRRSGGRSEVAAARRSSAIPSSTTSACSASPPRRRQWGWRVEGHHVSFRFAVDGGEDDRGDDPAVPRRESGPCARWLGAADPASARLPCRKTPRARSCSR